MVLSSERVSGQHFGRDLPDSHEVVLPGVGHLMPLEAPTEVSRAITAFTAGLAQKEA